MENNNTTLKKWYIVQTVSGYEQRVKEDLENRDFGGNVLEEIFLPEKITFTKAGKRRGKPLFPGYLYVKVDMSDSSWFIIRNTNYVTGIVGSSGQRTKPTPVSEDQITKIRGQVLEEQLKVAPTSTDGESIVGKSNLKIGDSVVINEGEFEGKDAKLIFISVETQKAKVEIDFLGRTTPIELAIDQIVKKQTI